MAYEINIHVNKNGKLETTLPLELSVYRESKRVKLIFDVDSEIDSTYHYLKFTHPKTSYLYRVHNNEFEIPKAITAYDGKWEVAFVACDEVANNDSSITANYIYASEPLVADVLRGNLGIIHSSEESVLLRQLTEGTFDHFEIPSGTSYIAQNFLAMQQNEFEVFVPYTVTQIKKYALYDSGCTKITFEEGSQLSTLDEYALYRIPNLGNIKFPSSLTNWGRYNLGGCGCERIEFEANSNLRALSSYSLWNIPGVKKIFLPDRLQSFTGGTAVIKNCPLLNEIWFPNSINVAIPEESIQECPSLSKISLQSNFNVNANFGSVSGLTREAVIDMFRNLKDLTGYASKVITLNQAVIDRLEDDVLSIARSKNWSVGSSGNIDILKNKTFHYENSTAQIDIEFGDSTGTITYGSASTTFEYQYLTETTFRIILPQTYDQSQWGNYKPAPLDNYENSDCLITLSSGEASTVKIKMYSNSGTGTNRTFNKVVE